MCISFLVLGSMRHVLTRLCAQESLGQALDDLRQDDLRAALFVALYNVVGTAIQKRLPLDLLQADLREKLQAPSALAQPIGVVYKSQSVYFCPSLVKWSFCLFAAGLSAVVEPIAPPLTRWLFCVNRKV